MTLTCCPISRGTAEAGEAGKCFASEMIFQVLVDGSGSRVLIHSDRHNLQHRTIHLCSELGAFRHHVFRHMWPQTLKIQSLTEPMRRSKVPPTQWEIGLPRAVFSQAFMGHSSNTVLYYWHTLSNPPLKEFCIL